MRKVRTPTQYKDWTDGDQREADAQPGFRYYLPRPFVAVKKEFVTASDTYLARGMLGPDGRVLAIEMRGLPAGWAGGFGEPAGREAFVDRGSDLFSTLLQGAHKSAGAARVDPVPQQINNAISLPAASLSTHLDNPGLPYSTTLTFNRIALGTDCHAGTITQVYLAPVVAGVLSPVKDFHVLPLALYKVGTAGECGTVELRNAFLTGLRAGSYVYAVRYNKLQAGVPMEFIAHADPSRIQLSVAHSWDPARDPALGSSDRPPVQAPLLVTAGIVIPRPPALSTPLERADVAFSFKAADLRTPEGTAIPGVTSAIAGTGVVTGAGLVRIVDGQFLLAEAVRLPFTGGTAKDVEAKVDYIGVINHLPPGRTLAPGNYHFIAWVTVEARDASLAVTQPVVTRHSVLSVAPPPPAAAVPGTPPAPGTVGPTPSTPQPAAPSAPSPVAGTPAAAGTGTSIIDRQGRMESAGGQLDLKVGGDPSNAPVTPINEYFDLVTLPDFEEQYTIQPKPRLSSATIELSLEQGWLLEHAGAVIDNKAIAQFLFDQVSKTLDMGRDLVRLDRGLLAPAVPAPAPAVPAPAAGGLGSGSALQGRKDAVAVAAIFKVHRRSLAVPGLYPLLKPREIHAAAKAAALASTGRDEGRDFQRTYMDELLRSGSMVRFTTREEYVVELLSFAQPHAQAPVRGNGGDGRGSPARDVRAEIQQIADGEEAFKDLDIVGVQEYASAPTTVLVQLKDRRPADGDMLSAFEQHLNRLRNASEPVYEVLPNVTSPD